MGAAGYVLGVDGGQSATLCLIATLDGLVVATGRGRGLDHLTRPGGLERLELALTEAVHEALQAGGLSSPVFEAAYLGLTAGVGAAEAILRRLVTVRLVTAESDAVCALAGGTGGLPGVVLLAGTGAVAYGETRRGERAWKGGWGYLLGDQGSGWWLGLQALQFAARCEDGAESESPLLLAVLTRFGAASMREVAATLYTGELDRSLVADLAPTVLEWAARGDSQALRIVEEGANHLARLVVATARALPFGKDERRVVGQGGVLKPGGPLWTAVERRLHAELPDFSLAAPRLPPGAGAVLLALRQLGIAPDERILGNLGAAAQASGGLWAKPRPVRGSLPR
ncbi:BadF/BadG/BcrA/BcrD ATPase family protein [Carboxydochorda subterranea]|uniref:BadF/BadG/BcrA/BcrD ATPase family protein n=1 Tax=Carboxydichorda subterranea TaxID=3109565 RepID=A0ABZ1BXB4_9FIRM|nr:BadF/BadG/BcrA/BcrD ATPase family protein [Limnochorda sp. L945t]WRP17439.1 BadF/BadG/BcrA/BcrD ATPase family protein [Limnochorda sp. L945t]